MVCNNPGMTTLERDRQIITSLGGPRKVADLMGFTGFAQQKVTNWMVRGIPAHVKVARPDLFMPELAERYGCKFPAPGHAAEPQQATGA